MVRSVDFLVRWTGKGEMRMLKMLAFGVIVAGGLNDMIGVRDELGAVLLRVGWWRGWVEGEWEVTRG